MYYLNITLDIKTNKPMITLLLIQNILVKQPVIGESSYEVGLYKWKI